MWNLPHYLAKSAQSWLAPLLFDVLSTDVSKHKTIFSEGYIRNLFISNLRKLHLIKQFRFNMLIQRTV